MRILYVEDNPANVFLVKRVAKMGNHEIINFIDGGEALKKFPEIFPDLILMDVQLSGELNGLDVVRRLRADGVKTPIIAVTAYAMVGDKERCIDAGCDDYLAKPLPIPRLLEIFDIYDPTKQAAKAPEPAKKDDDDDMPIIITVPPTSSSASPNPTPSPDTSTSPSPTPSTDTSASPSPAPSSEPNSSATTSSTEPAPASTVTANPSSTPSTEVSPSADSPASNNASSTPSSSNATSPSSHEEVKSEESGAAKTESSEKTQ